jgi:hypothetical protein
MTIGSRARCRLNFERRAGKRAAGPSAGEKIVAGPPGFHFLEDRERAIRQRNAMLAAFVRAGGTVQTLQAKSISSQRAAAASPERAVARIANSRAHAAVVGRSRRLATKDGTSPCRARSVGKGNQAQIRHGNRRRVWRGYVPIDSKHSAGMSLHV